MDMIDIETEQRLEDNQRIMKKLGSEARNLQVGMPPPVKIVAGNKCDLKDGRAISARDGLEYARKHGCGFMETSAREIVNIEETFARMLTISCISMIRVLTKSVFSDCSTCGRGSKTALSISTTLSPNGFLYCSHTCINCHRTTSDRPATTERWSTSTRRIPTFWW